MYKFCKINLFGQVSPWTLEIDSYEKYKEWNELYQLKYLAEGAENIKLRIEIWEKQSKSKHPHRRLQGHWSSEVGMLSEMAGRDGDEIDLIEGFNRISDQLITSKYVALVNEGAIYVCERCQWFVKPEQCPIAEFIEKDKMIYPKYSKEDILITRWENGTHYYAKIGNNDVIDENGNRIWRTHDFAYKNALEALLKMNS